MPFTDEQLAQQMNRQEEAQANERTPGGMEENGQISVIQGDDADGLEANSSILSGEEEKKEGEVSANQSLA